MLLWYATSLLLKSHQLSWSASCSKFSASMFCLTTQQVHSIHATTSALDTSVHHPRTCCLRCRMLSPTSPQRGPSWAGLSQQQQCLWQPWALVQLATRPASPQTGLHCPPEACAPAAEPQSQAAAAWAAACVPALAAGWMQASSGRQPDLALLHSLIQVQSASCVGDSYIKYSVEEQQQSSLAWQHFPIDVAYGVLACLLCQSGAHRQHGFPVLIVSRRASRHACRCRGSSKAQQVILKSRRWRGSSRLTGHAITQGQQVHGWELGRSIAWLLLLGPVQALHGRKGVCTAAASGLLQLSAPVIDVQPQMLDAGSESAFSPIHDRPLSDRAGLCISCQG